jgi:hypothetical protein
MNAAVFASINFRGFWWVGGAMTSRADLTNIKSFSSDDWLSSAYQPAGDVPEINWDDDEATYISQVLLSFIALVVLQSLSRRLSKVWMREANKVNHSLEKRAEKYIRYILVIGMINCTHLMENEEVSL